MTALAYSDIYLTPRYSTLRSRAEADIGVEFLGCRFAAPITPSNMESVINPDIAKWLSENDLPYFMHRFGNTKEFIRRANDEKWKLISVSVGVKETDRSLLSWVVDCGYRIDWLCIDTAHGHSAMMREMIAHIKKWLPDTKIIAGNVATPEAVRDLAKWGAAAVKVGIGGGRSCSTKDQTGFHVPMFSCVKSCAEEGGGWGMKDHLSGDNVFRCPTVLPASVSLILDGGIRSNGDIAKALVAASGGACQSIVMAGSLFAACTDAPGENVYQDGKPCAKTAYQVDHPETISPDFKRHYGSASARQKGSNRHVEGFEVELPCNGLTVAQKMEEIKQSLQSAVSYAGGRSLAAFKDVKWVSTK